MVARGTQIAERGFSLTTNIQNRTRTDKGSRVENSCITQDPESVLIVNRGVIRRCPFHGWEGLLAAADALECIMRREGKVLIAVVVEPWQAAEFWGHA